MICFPQLLHFVSQLTNFSSIHTRLNIYHRRYNGSKMRRSWKSARREISARQVHGTCVHVIPWPGKQDRSARLTYTVARALFAWRKRTRLFLSRENVEQPGGWEPATIRGYLRPSEPANRRNTMAARGCGRVDALLVVVGTHSTRECVLFHIK